MAHMIESYDRVYTHTGDPRAWHLLDQQLELSKLSRDQFKALAHYMIEAQMLKWADGTTIPGLKGWKSSLSPDLIYQMPDSETRIPSQPYELLEWAWDVAHMIGGRISSLGSIRGNRQYWCCVEIPESEWNVGDGDTIKRFLYFSISWDGAYPTVCVANDLRTVCWNTTPALEYIDKAGHARLATFKGVSAGDFAKENAAKLTVEKFRAYQNHSKMAKQELVGRLVSRHVDIANDPTLLTKFAQALVDSKGLLDRVVNYQPTGNFIEDCLNADIDMKEWSEVKTKGLSNPANQVVTLALNGLGSQLPTARNTPWGLLNGFTAMEDHERGKGNAVTSREDVREMSRQIRFVRQLVGDNSPDKANAILLASAIANTKALAN